MTQYSFHKCYENPEVYEMFSSFLEESKNLELLKFYEMTKNFNLLMNQTFKERQAKRIIELFLKNDSVDQVNIPVEALEETMSRYEKAVKGETLFESIIFAPCYKVVAHDLKHDAFYRFKFDPKFTEFMEKKKKKLSELEFKAKYTINDIKLKLIETENESDSEDDSESTQEENLMNYLTVRIMFTQEDIDKTFEGSEINVNNYVMNRMIMDMMKPFVGVQLTQIKSNGKKLNAFLNQVVGLKKRSSEEISKIRKFTKEDSLTWISAYFKLTQYDTQTSMKIFELLQKYSVISLIEQFDGFETKGIYQFNLRKKCVIVGAGVAGIRAANNLKNEMDVTIIDKKKEYTFINGIYTLITNPTLVEDYEFSIESLVKGCNVVHSNVYKISSSAVYLESGTMPFDYLIVATGSHYFVPYEIEPRTFTQRFPGEKFSDIKDALYDKENINIVVPYKKGSIISNYQNIRKSEKIVIVGGGSVAVESAGEIASKYPKIEIFIITQYSRILKKYKDKKISQATMKIFNEYGNIKVLESRVITNVSGKTIHFKSINEDFSVKTIEESIEADVLINAMGLRPNTKIFNQFMSDSINAKGAVEINEYFQVQYGKHEKVEDEVKSDEETTEDVLSTTDEISEFEDITRILETMNVDVFSLEVDSISDEDVYENIYAIGDIVNLHEEKLNNYAQIHADSCTSNILLLEQSLDLDEFKENATKYKTKDAVQYISIGSKGVVIRGKKYVTHGTVSKYKNENITKQIQTLRKISESDE